MRFGVLECGQRGCKNPSSVCCVILKGRTVCCLCKKGRSRIDYFVLEWFSVATTMNCRGTYNNQLPQWPCFRPIPGSRIGVYRGVDSCLQRYGAGCDAPPTQPHPAQSMNAVQDQIFVMPVEYAPYICTIAIHNASIWQREIKCLFPGPPHHRYRHPRLCQKSTVYFPITKRNYPASVLMYILFFIFS